MALTYFFMLNTVAVLLCVPVLLAVLILLLHRRSRTGRKKAPPHPPFSKEEKRPANQEDPIRGAGEFQRYYYEAQQRGQDIEPWDIPPERMPWEP